MTVADREEVVKVRAEALGVDLTPEEIVAMAWAGVGLAAHDLEEVVRFFTEEFLCPVVIFDCYGNTLAEVRA